MSMQNVEKLPFYYPDSVELLSQCSPLSPPSSAGRCRSAGQWLAHHSFLCTPRVHQSPGSCCPRSLQLGRTCHRISAGAWQGCQSPCSWRRLAHPRRSTCLWGEGLWGFRRCSCTDAQSLRCLDSCFSSFFQLLTPGQPPPLPVFKRRWSHCDKSGGKKIV